jgi:hypothetical protein
VVLVAWAIFLRRQIGAIAAYTWRIEPAVFVLATGWSALYFGGLALCWGALLRSMAGEQYSGSTAASARVWLLSMSTRYLPGNVWHILTRVALASRLRVAGSIVLASATVEQVLTLLGALALFAATVPFWDIFPSSRRWLLLLVPVGLAVIHPRVLGALLGLAARRLRRPELAWSYTYAAMLRALALYVAAMFCSALALWTLLWGLGPVMPSQFALVVGSAALAWAVGYLSFLTPSGLGVREALLVALLAQSFPMATAIVASLLFRLVMTLGEILVVGGVWSIGLARSGEST